MKCDYCRLEGHDEGAESCPKRKADTERFVNWKEDKCLFCSNPRPLKHGCKKQRWLVCDEHQTCKCPECGGLAHFMEGMKRGNYYLCFESLNCWWRSPNPPSEKLTSKPARDPFTKVETVTFSCARCGFQGPRCCFAGTPRPLEAQKCPCCGGRYEEMTP